MKILLTGVYSTGKTTLAAALADELAAIGVSVSVRPDPARGCPLPLNTAQTYDATHWMAGSVLMREAALSRDASAVLICDRGLPDILSHTFDVEADINAEGPRFGIDALTRLCSDWSDTYDFVFRTTIDFAKPIIEDGLRVADRAYQVHMDHMLTKALESTGVDYFRLPPTLKERVNAVMSVSST